LPLDYYRNNVAGTITLLEVNEEQDVVVVVKDGGVIINSPTVSCPSL
jgi:UDP-glucose 4-epimerase